MRCVRQDVCSPTMELKEQQVDEALHYKAAVADASTAVIIRTTRAAITATIAWEENWKRARSALTNQATGSSSTGNTRATSTLQQRQHYAALA
jgi:hypothetical protein